MPTINELKWQTLTAAVNEMKSPNQFLKKMLFGNHQTVPTEDIEIHTINRDREIAPFVRKNGEAIMVGGYTSKIQTVAPPNIRIKRPFQASELLFGRRPGTVIHLPNARTQLTAIQEHVARDMQGLADMVTNAEEYLCAMALQGTITYEVEDEEVFEITFPKPADNNITMDDFLDEIPSPAEPGVMAGRLETLIHSVKRLVSEASCPGITDCVMGTEASDALRYLVATGELEYLLNTRDIAAGDFSFAEQFTDDGVIFIGRFGGIRFWEYGRTANLNGVSTDMIRPKYMEFFSRSNASQRVLYYGAIADMKALQGRLYQGERFSKSWEVEDPSAMFALLASRPLPVPRRPAATVSAKVVSG